MKLDIPFYKQTSLLNCGPNALRMVVSYFNEDKGIDFLEKETGIKKDKGIFTIQIATGAASLGYNVEFYSKQILFDEEYLKMDFYKKYADINTDESVRLIQEAKEKGVKVFERKLELNEILSKLNKDCVPIILLDWNIITGKNGYQGHAVPIVGYDEENIFVHNAGLNRNEAFFPIKKELFDLARKSSGTDEDIVFINRKYE